MNTIPDERMAMIRRNGKKFGLMLATIAEKCFGKCIHVVSDRNGNHVVRLCVTFWLNDGDPADPVDLRAFPSEEEAESFARKVRRMLANIVNLSRETLKEIQDAYLESLEKWKE